MAYHTQTHAHIQTCTHRQIPILHFNNLIFGTHTHTNTHRHRYHFYILHSLVYIPKIFGIPLTYTCPDPHTCTFIDKQMYSDIDTLTQILIHACLYTHTYTYTDLHVVNCYFKSTFYVKIGQNCYFEHAI